MRISDWSSDVCSSDLLPEAQCFGVEGELEEALAVVGGHMAGGLGGGDMMPAKALHLQERRKPRAILLDAQGVGGHGRTLSWLHQPSIIQLRLPGLLAMSVEPIQPTVCGFGKGSGV